MIKIDDFKADDQNTLEEQTTQNEEAVKLSTSRNLVNVDGGEVDVDCKSLHED